MGSEMCIRDRSLSGNIQNDASVVVRDLGGSPYSGVISGSGDVVWDMSPSGLLVWHQQHYTGLTHITGGRLIANSLNPFAGDIRIDGGSELLLNGSGPTVPYEGTISGAGDVAVGTYYTATWSADHTFTGRTVIGREGTLTLGTGGNTGSIAVSYTHLTLPTRDDV